MNRAYLSAPSGQSGLWRLHDQLPTPSPLRRWCVMSTPAPSSAIASSGASASLTSAAMFSSLIGPSRDCTVRTKIVAKAKPSDVDKFLAWQRPSAIEWLSAYLATGEKWSADVIADAKKAGYNAFSIQSAFHRAGGRSQDGATSDRANTGQFVSSPGYKRAKWSLPARVGRPVQRRPARTWTQTTPKRKRNYLGDQETARR